MTNQQPNLIKQVLSFLLRDIFKSDYVLLEKGYSCPGCGFDALTLLRNNGDTSPVVIAGFTNQSQLKKQYREALSDSQNAVFYLQLPCSFSELNKVINQAKEAPNAQEFFFDRQKAIREIRAFKHTCDNVWNAWHGNIGQARKSLAQLTESFPESLRELKVTRLEKLAAEYDPLADNAFRLGISRAHDVPHLFAKMIQTLRNAGQEEKLPLETILLLETCLEHLKQIANILKSAKEIEFRDE